MATMTGEQSEAMERVRFLVKELSRTGFIPEACPLLASQINAAEVLAGRLTHALLDAKRVITRDIE